MASHCRVKLPWSTSHYVILPFLPTLFLATAFLILLEPCQFSGPKEYSVVLASGPLYLFFTPSGTLFPRFSHGLFPHFIQISSHCHLFKEAFPHCLLPIHFVNNLPCHTNYSMSSMRLGTSFLCAQIVAWVLSM